MVTCFVSYKNLPTQPSTHYYGHLEDRSSVLLTAARAMRGLRDAASTRMELQFYAATSCAE